MEDYGILIIRATTASGAYPVADVNVSVRGVSDIGSDVEISVLTNQDGATQPILLPTPPRSLSLTPENAQEPFSRYEIEIYKEGFYRKKLFDVAVFAGITSVLPVNMIPVTEYNTGENEPIGNQNAVITEDLNVY